MLYVKTDGKIRVDKKLYSYDDIKTNSSYGVVIPDGYCVIDADNKRACEIIDKRLEYEKIVTKVTYTTNGKHYWFKDKNVSSKTGFICDLGTLKYSDRDDGKPHGIDLKSGNKGKLAYVIVKLNGVERETYNSDIIADLPYWLVPSNGLPKSLDPDFTKLGQEGNRNESLFKQYRTWQLQRGRTHEQLKDNIIFMNDCLFTDKLDMSEIESICRVTDDENEIIPITTPDYVVIEKNRIKVYDYGTMDWRTYNSKQGITAVELYLGDLYPFQKFDKQQRIQFISDNSGNSVPVCDIDNIYLADGVVTSDGLFIEYCDELKRPQNHSPYTYNEIKQAEKPSWFEQYVGLNSKDDDIYTISLENLNCLSSWLATDSRNKKCYCVLYGESNGGKSKLIESILKAYGCYSNYSFSNLFKDFTLLEGSPEPLLYDTDISLILGNNTEIFKKLSDKGIRYQIKFRDGEDNGIMYGKKFLGACNSPEIRVGKSKMDITAVQNRIIMLPVYSCKKGDYGYIPVLDYTVNDGAGDEWNKLGLYIMSEVINYKESGGKLDESTDAIERREIISTSYADKFYKVFCENFDNFGLNMIPYSEVKKIYTRVVNSEFMSSEKILSQTQSQGTKQWRKLLTPYGIKLTNKNGTRYFVKEGTDGYVMGLHREISETMINIIEQMD